MIYICGAFLLNKFQTTIKLQNYYPISLIHFYHDRVSFAEFENFEKKTMFYHESKLKWLKTVWLTLAHKQFVLFDSQSECRMSNIKHIIANV